MENLSFSHINSIGAMFDLYTKAPYLVFKIDVDGKEYTGTVPHIKIKAVGHEIESGEFHPYLNINFFTSFDIFPNSYTIKEIIDLKSNKGVSQPFNVLFHGLNLITLMESADIGVVKRSLPELLSIFRQGIIDFQLEHPEIKSENSLLIIDEAIRRFNIIPAYALHSMTNTEINQLLKYTKEDMIDSLNQLLFKQ